MKFVAYKRADNPHSKVKGNLPDDFITEWMYVDPNNKPPASDGWQTLQEDQFQTLLASSNTQASLDAHEKAKFDASQVPPDRIKGTQ